MVLTNTDYFSSKMRITLRGIESRLNLKKKTADRSREIKVDLKDLPGTNRGSHEPVLMGLNLACLLSHKGNTNLLGKFLTACKASSSLIICTGALERTAAMCASRVNRRDMSGLSTLE